MFTAILLLIPYKLPCAPHSRHESRAERPDCTEWSTEMQVILLYTCGTGAADLRVACREQQSGTERPSRTAAL